MKNMTKVLVSASAILAALAQVPTVQIMVAAFVSTHPGASAIGAFLTFVGGLLYHPSTPATAK